MQRLYSPIARVLITTGLLLMVMLLSACQQSKNRPPTHPVKGSLLVNGKPANGALITFHPANGIGNGRVIRSLATVKEDGSFVLTTFNSYDGAPPGEYVVTVYWPGPVSADSPAGEIGPDRLKGRFSTPDRPLTRVTIREGANELPTLKIGL